MIVIDGARGEGGGQILRSSLALATVRGLPCRIDHIRAARKKPGLLRQHLTAARAAAAVSSGSLVGDEIGSDSLTFRPGTARAGEYEFRVGTAGSTTLVLQTILPALITADGPSRVALEGGTHNPFAPPYDFLALAYLPLLERMGARVAATLERPGFFPAGGGRIVVEIEPAGRLQPLELLERTAIRRQRATAWVANLPRGIGERELKLVARKLGWRPSELRIEAVTGGAGPGNVIVLEVESPEVTEVFTGFGEVRRSAEQVAHNAVRACQKYLASTAPVGEYLADQLLLLLALAGGGAFRTTNVTRHTRTHAELLEIFGGVQVEIDDSGRDGSLVRIR